MILILPLLLLDDPCVVQGKVINIGIEVIRVQVNKSSRFLDVKITDKTVIKSWDGNTTNLQEVKNLWNERKYKFFVYLRYDYDYRVPYPEIITPIEIYFGVEPYE